MLPDSALRNFHPIIITPSHDGKYFHNYVFSLVTLLNDARNRGLNIELMLCMGESLVQRARNNCVAQFLEHPEWTHLIWIDSDIGFQPKALYRLLLSDHDIAAGVYPMKKENWPEKGLPKDMTKQEYTQLFTRYTINTISDENKEARISLDQDDFFPLSEAPTGFMCIKRSVFEKMMAAYPERQYVPDSPGVVNKGLHYLFFDCFVDPASGRYLSEDYGFCWLWRQLGGRVYVDAQSNLTHQGMKLYEGPFAQTLMKNPPFAVGAPSGSHIRIVKGNPQAAAPAEDNAQAQAESTAQAQAESHNPPPEEEKPAS